MVLGEKDREPHPLLDEQVLRRVLTGISTSAAPVALGELIRLLASMPDVRDMDVRATAQQVFALDEAAQAQLRQAAGLYLSNAYSARSVRYKALGQDFHAFLGQVYDLLMSGLIGDFTIPRDDPLRAEILLRTVRTAAGEFKWAAFDYQSLAPEAWRRAMSAYRLALSAGVADLPVRLREGRESRTTVSREFARLVALQCAGFEQLPPERIEAADKLTRFVQHALRLTGEPLEGSQFSVDLDGFERPRRLLNLPEAAGTLRFFRPGDAVPVLGDLASSVLQPGGHAAFAGTHPAEVGAAIAHLNRQWGNRAPMRQYRRHPMRGEVSLSTGLGLVRSLISGEAQFRPAPAWHLVDASRDGFCVTSRLFDGEVCRVGTLVGAYLGEWGTWTLAVVRRVQHGEREGTSVGLQILTSGPRPAALDDGSRRWLGVLCDPVVRGRALRVVCEPGFTGLGGRLFVRQGPRTVKVEVEHLVVRGPGFEVWGCKAR